MFLLGTVIVILGIVVVTQKGIVVMVEKVGTFRGFYFVDLVPFIRIEEVVVNVDGLVFVREAVGV